MSQERLHPGALEGKFNTGGRKEWPFIARNNPFLDFTHVRELGRKLDTFGHVD